MQRTLKVLGLALTYPSAELQGAVGEMKAALAAEKALPRKQRAGVERLLDWLAGQELMDAQAAYVALFDRSRRLSLYLYEHLHGESRDRGGSMVRLRMLYERHGLEPDPQELPDYLPMVCEFLSLLPPKAAKSVLADAAHLLEALRTRLAERDSLYEPVAAGLVHLAGARVNDKALRQVLEGQPKEIETWADLDADWAEEPVTWGPDGRQAGVAGSGAAGCQDPAAR